MSEPTNVLNEFVELCVTCGISSMYFESVCCHEYLDLVTEFESFDSIYKDIYDNVKWTLERNGDVCENGMRYIEREVIKKLVHPKISNHFHCQFNLNVNVLVEFAEKNILNLNHDYDFENVNNLHLRHKNWNMVFIVLNLFRNLKITKYVKWLDRLIKSKTELLENADCVITNQNELELVKQFYREQLLIIL